MHHLDWHYEKCQTLFPQDPDLRLVDRYYPYAVKGPLLVDEIDSEDKYGILRCKEKAKVLKDAGYRYVWLTETMDEQAAFEQLGEV